MQGNAGETTGSSSAGLAHLLLSSYQEQLIQNRLQEEQELEDGAREEEEDEDEEDEESRTRFWVNPPPSPLPLTPRLPVVCCRTVCAEEGRGAHGGGEGSAQGGVRQSDVPALP